MLFNVFILYSKSLDYSKFGFEYLNLSQKFSLRDTISSSENNIGFGNEIFLKFGDNDDFLYRNIQENEDLNVEKSINSNWGKKLFRFSAISVGTFPIVLFVGLFCFDLFYYFSDMDGKDFPYPFSNGFALSKDKTFEKFVISTSAGLTLSLIIALIDCFID